MSLMCNTLDEMTQVNIDGDLTIYTVTELAAQLIPLPGEKRQIEVDLSQVTEIDGAGLQLLIQVKREALRAGIALRLTAPSKAVLDTFDLCNLGAFFSDSMVASATQR